MYAMRPHDHIVKDHPALWEMLVACTTGEWVVVDGYQWVGPFATAEAALAAMQRRLTADVA